MTAAVDIANRALSSCGARGISQISSLTEDSNEAAVCNLWYASTRDEVLRMAPWGCATYTNTIAVLKAAPGTPENPTTTETVWSTEFPPPPWFYEYAYPIDCLRALWIVPQFATGFTSSIPLTPAANVSLSTYWNGPPVRFKIAVDKDDSDNDIRVILTNQEDAILTYIKSVTNPDVWDPLLEDAIGSALAGKIVYSLTGDKELANLKLKEANGAISIARAGDGNEGLTINDVTPDWIRTRGIAYPYLAGYGQDNAFDWGPLLTMY